MKIGVYGDSFSCINTKWDTSKALNSHLGISWVEFLENAGHEITNFAESGTAFMFSYEHFLKNHRNFDINIFVVTNPQRVYVKELDGIKIFDWEWAESEYRRIKKLPFYPKKDLHLEIIDSVRVYMKSWIDWEMVTHVQHVLVNNLWNLAPNTLVIPAFEDSMMQTTVNLNSAAKYELKFVDEKEHKNFDFGWLDCKRKCHFSNENNIVLGQLILDAIKKQDKILEFSLDKLVKPANSDFYFYVRSNKYDIRNW